MNSNEKELISVRIPKELNRRFAKHVASLGISKTAFILNLINQELRKEATFHVSEFDKNESQLNVNL